MRAPANHGGGFEIPDGTYTAICIMVIDCGVWEREYMGQAKTKREIYLRWELPEVIIPDGEYAGKPAGIGSRYTFSMFKKANFCRDLSTWRGRPFTDKEAAEFDPATLAGQTCTLQVYTSDAGYANINLITPYKGSLKPSEPIFVFDTEEYTQAQFDKLPEWIQKKINLPDPADQETAAEYSDVISQPGASDFDDDIPF